jgi:uncharacterized membrane protein YjgN (DUF898 family)
VKEMKRKKRKSNKVIDILAVLAVLSLFGIATVAAIAIMPSVASAYPAQITSFTPDDNLNIRIINIDAAKFQAYFAYKGRTTMNPIAQALVDAGNTHNMNSIFIIGKAHTIGYPFILNMEGPHHRLPTNCMKGSHHRLP